MQNQRLFFGFFTKKMKKLFIPNLLLSIFLLPWHLCGQHNFNNNLIFYSDSIGTVYLDMPLVTLPSQIHAYKTTGGFFKSYMNPGLDNSLTYSADMYSSVHYGLKSAARIKKSKGAQIFLQRLLVSGFDVVSQWLPLGAPWLHEEYHRGVMSQYGINSFNEVLLFPFGKSSIAVNKVKDEDLAMLCDYHHSDFVRLMSAGHEAEVHLVRNLQSNEFFYHQNLDNEVLYIMYSIQNIMYVSMCANGSGDENTKKRNAIETTIASRDFTGMDMNAWIDALCNPDKPYSARGIHPSGVGINRYIMYEDISAEGRKYLKRQAYLDIFNFMSPMMLGFSHIRLANTEAGAWYGNFAFRHYLTSFGDDVSLDLYLQSPKFNLYTTFHSYNNLNHHFGGIEAGLIDFPLLDNQLQLGGTVMFWVQPKDMLFHTGKGEAGGLVKAKIAYNYRFIAPTLEIGWKSKGWVAGNVSLKPSFFLWFGIRWKITR